MPSAANGGASNVRGTPCRIDCPVSWDSSISPALTASTRSCSSSLPKHNGKFAAPPAKQENAYVKPAERVDVDSLFVHREMCKADCGGSILQRLNLCSQRREEFYGTRFSAGGRKILSGKIQVVYKSRRIEMKEVKRPERTAPDRATKENEGELVDFHRPAPDHPERCRFNIPGHCVSGRQDMEVTFSLNA